MQRAILTTLGLATLAAAFILPLWWMARSAGLPI